MAAARRSLPSESFFTSAAKALLTSLQRALADTAPESTITTMLTYAGNERSIMSYAPNHSINVRRFPTRRTGDLSTSVNQNEGRAWLQLDAWTLNGEVGKEDPHRASHYSSGVGTLLANVITA